MQQGIILGLTLFLLMVGDNAYVTWGLFDQLHHRSRCSFCGSHKSLKLYVDAKNNDSMSQIISKRLICVLVFPFFGASKLCSEYLQQQFNLSSLNLGLGSIESGDSFTWVVSELPREPKSTVCGCNGGCFSVKGVLVGVVKIEEMLVVINGREDRIYKLWGEILQEAALQIISGAGFEKILSHAYVVPCREKEREQISRAIAGYGASPSMPTTQAPSRGRIIAFIPTTANTHILQVVLPVCIGAISTNDDDNALTELCGGNGLTSSIEPDGDGILSDALYGLRHQSTTGIDETEFLVRTVRYQDLLVRFHIQLHIEPGAPIGAYTTMSYEDITYLYLGRMSTEKCPFLVLRVGPHPGRLNL